MVLSRGQQNPWNDPPREITNEEVTHTSATGKDQNEGTHSDELEPLFNYALNQINVEPPYDMSDSEVYATASSTRATTEQRFKYWLSEIGKKSLPAYEHLACIEPQIWSRHAFAFYPRCDILLNNICETFNAFVLETREKPILTMLEMIRSMLMRRMHKKREGMKKYSGDICPRIQKKIEKAKEDANSCIASAAGGTKIQIEHMNGEIHVVDLKEKTCTCRNLQLTGLPCGHGVCGIRYDRGRIDDYVHPCYRKETFLNIYDHIIQPMPGPELWPHVTGFPPILPPSYAKQRGAPKKKRRREADEPKASDSKEGVEMSCGKCGNKGHNDRTCKGQPQPERATKYALHVAKAAQRRIRRKNGIQDPPSERPRATNPPPTTTHLLSQRPIGTVERRILLFGGSSSNASQGNQVGRSSCSQSSIWANRNQLPPAPFDLSRFSSQPRRRGPMAQTNNQPFVAPRSSTQP